MILRSCIKRYKDDTHRALPPEETMARAEAKMPAAGITRVADITNLDRIGIPVFHPSGPWQIAVLSQSTTAKERPRPKPGFRQ